MSFAAPIFLWYFMPAVLAIYWVLPTRARSAIVAVASILFYAYGAGPFVLLLLACMVVNYTAGRLVDREASRGDAARRAILVGAVVVDLGILAVWKYAGFASAQVSALSQLLGHAATPVVHLALPIGISFFTFHHLSYVVDVYRGSRRAQRDPVKFVTYIAMFPQLVAGPIVRYHEIADQLEETTRPKLRDLSEGFPRFVWGLTKKVVVADSVAPVADAVFATPAGQLPTHAAWLGALAYTVQIYFDFSGYSDMAIGLGQMLGFRLPENFDRPYSSRSITDFWRRWHMSLSRWFRDYVYIPLGGNRRGSRRTYLNLLIVFVLTGFWHGANWTFLAWGLYHGGWLVVERLTGYARREVGPAARAGQRAVTFVIVVVGWVLFRADSMPQAATVISRMFTWHPGELPVGVTGVLTTFRVILLLLGMTVVLVPRSWVFGRVLHDDGSRFAVPARLATSVALAPLAAIVVAAGTFSPFLYFQF